MKQGSHQLYVKELPRGSFRRYSVMWGIRGGPEMCLASFHTRHPADKLIELLGMLTELDETMLLAERLGLENAVHLEGNKDDNA